MKPYPHNTDYLVSRLGQVYSTKRKGRILRPAKNSGGYFCVVLCSGGQTCLRAIHRLVLETYRSDCPAGMECRHLDGNKENNYISNLCWGTRKENTQDREKHRKERQHICRLHAIRLIKEIF